MACPSELKFSYEKCSGRPLTDPGLGRADHYSSIPTATAAKKEKEKDTFHM